MLKLTKILGVNNNEKRFSEKQIINFLKETEAEAKVADVCLKHNVAVQTYYSWKAKFGEMSVSEAQRLRTRRGKPQTQKMGSRLRLRYTKPNLI